MSDAETAAQQRAPTSQLVSDLKVSGHLMSFDQGLFCIVHTPSPGRDPSRPLPGVRVSLPPGIAPNASPVTIKSFQDDGWLYGYGDAALVRVDRGPAQVLVTIYQATNDAESAPNLQVLRLFEGGPPSAARPMPAGAQPSQEVVDVVAHVQGRGDVGGLIGQWIGDKGSKRWIEGFALAPLKDVAASDVEYQAVLGRGWMSPWVEGGQFCGSRGMALPLLGVRIRLRGAAAETHEVSYSASFVDGTEIGPVDDGEPCEAESLAAMEAFQVMIRPRGEAEATPEAVQGRRRSTRQKRS